jgi:hypothetical protein
VGLASRKPDTFHVERKIVIKASPDIVFANLDDFHRWSAWSPWEKLDPELTRSYSGQPKGVGAVYEWKGNKQVGRGRMTIDEAHPSDRVAIHLEFFEPFAADNRALFTLTPGEAGTTVAWGMSGPTPFGSKVFMVFADMDKLVGGDFDRGLGNLKQVCEAGAGAAAR